jgi:hypothetical protein
MIAALLRAPRRGAPHALRHKHPATFDHGTLSHKTRLNETGAAMEEHMAVDVALWAILAAAIGFIGCGCIYTATSRKPQDPEAAYSNYKMDRAA